MKINRVLLVGGVGYLGRHLSNKLSKSRFTVFSTGTSERKQDNYFKIDFNDKKTYEELKSENFDLIIVLASRLNSLGTTDLDHPDLKDNTTSYADFLAFIAKNKISGKLIYISSMTVYSPENRIPVTEDGFIAPVHTYGLSKVIAEKLTTFFCENNDISGVIFRIPGIYGGDRKSGFIFNSINSILNNESITINTNELIFWETIHIDDLTEMIKSFLENYRWEEQIDIFNISYGKQTDFYATIDFIKEILNSSQNIKDETTRSYIPFNLSNSKIKRLINIKEDYYGKLENYIRSVAE